MQEFHEKFANHARDTFNEYEPEFDESHWENMKKILPKKEEKKKSLLFWWTSGIAASLLAIISIGYNFTPRENNFVLSENSEIKSNSSFDLAIRDNSSKTTKPEKQNLIDRKNTPSFRNSSSNQDESINHFESKVVSSEKDKNLASNIEKDHTLHPTQKEIGDQNNYNQKQDIKLTESQLEPYLKYQNDLRKLDSDMNHSIYIVSNIESILTKDSTAKNRQSIIKESQYSKINDVLTHQDPVFFKKKNILTDSNIVLNDLLFEVEDSIIDISNDFIKDDKDDENKKDRWNPAFGVQLSSVSNYNSSTDPNVNMGGGLMSKLPIFKKIIDIRTGFNLQKQNVNSLLVNTDNSFGDINNNFTSKKLDAQLLSIEIPINFAVNYELNNKSVIFASAGFSSFTYLNEKYSYDYTERSTTSSIETYSEKQTVQVQVQNNETVSLISNEHIFIISEASPNTITTPEVYTPSTSGLNDQFVIGNSTSTEYDYTFNQESGLVQNNEVNTAELKKLDEVTITIEKKVIHTDRKEETKKVESKEAAFSTFDLASMVNFSFGMSYPLGGRNTITIEPFMKIPVRKLTSRNLSYSLAGVNFTYLFGRN